VRRTKADHHRSFEGLTDRGCWHQAIAQLPCRPPTTALTDLPWRPNRLQFFV
jgi:hypothetical protein